MFTIVWSKNLKYTDHLEDICLYGRIIVKIDLKNNLEVKQVASRCKGQNNSVAGKIVMTYLGLYVIAYLYLVPRLRMRRARS